MKVAFARIKITPKNYVGIPLAGYTPMPACDGKLDDVHAHGVLLEDVALGNIKRHLLLISMDILKPALLFSDYIKEKIQEAHHINPGQVLIHATHTHKGPDVTGEFYKPGGYLALLNGIMGRGNTPDHDRYLVWIARRVVKLVGRLLENLTPAKMAWAKEPIARDDVVINRRHPTWRTRPDLWVFAFRAERDDRLLGFVTHFACHGTTLANTVSKLSADFPGRVVARVEEETGGELTTVYFNGPSGDLNPITTCGTDFDWLEKPENRQAIYGQGGTYKSTKRIGYAIADQALALARGIPTAEFLPRLRFKVFQKTFWVPLKDYAYWGGTFPKNHLIHLAKKYLLLRVAMSHEEPNFPGLAVKHRGNQVAIYSMLQWIQLEIASHDGQTTRDLSILTAPGELFEEIGTNLKARCPTGPENTVIFQNSNDWIAYLFPLHEYEEQGGYEPLPSFSPLCGVYVEAELTKLFREVQLDASFAFS